jgi:hypothetical protein
MTLSNLHIAPCAGRNFQPAAVVNKLGAAMIAGADQRFQLYSG